MASSEADDKGEASVGSSEGQEVPEEGQVKEAESSKATQDLAEAADGSTKAAVKAVKAPSDASSGGTVVADATSAQKAGQSEKQLTLFSVCADQGNKDVMMLFAGFSFALAVVPVVGLVATEYLLRSFVDDANTRWMYSGAMAVVLVNLVLVAYVIWCFVEGFPDADKAKATLRPGADNSQSQGADSPKSQTEAEGEAKSGTPEPKKDQ
ncbi:unnamed protein product [Polarella glacialis]|uniref:Vacuolar ATPase assembly integral membrane protein VMA21 homolog n=1 Tax=Polarella glacialis TaxID=89957 RepID=A0A813KXZ9_POLGL|nr:unnamed protein product [Polarella glacialis]